MAIIQIISLGLFKMAGSIIWTDFWFYLEIILIISVIIFQFLSSRSILNDITEFENIFTEGITVRSGYIERNKLNKRSISINDIVFCDIEDETLPEFDQSMVKIFIAETPGEGAIKRICDDINNYLLNNYGAPVNFSIIKDIIDREMDVKDEEISHSIPTPLYAGLGATMIGIIFGLFSVSDVNGIDALISGVKLAMFGSLFGLVCTTSLSSGFYRSAKKKVLNSRNRKISYLQAMLLPEMLKAEESGLSGLKATIDRFGRDTVNSATVLYNTVVKTESNLKSHVDITQNQKDIINKIENYSVKEFVRANLQLLDKLEKNIASFSQFASYLELMGKISSQLQDFGSRTENVNKIVYSIDNSLKDNKELITFLSAHFREIEKAGNAAVNAVDSAHSNFKVATEKLSYSIEEIIQSLNNSINQSGSKFTTAIDELNNEVKTRIENLNKNSEDQQIKIAEMYNEMSVKLTALANEHLKQLESVFLQATPKFDELKHLSSLQDIKEQLISNNTPTIKTLTDLLGGVNNSIIKISDNVNPKELINKLVSIEDSLNKRKNGPTAKPGIPTGEPNSKGSIKKNISLLHAISVGLFNRKKNG